jgi:uncharacterized UBP type Zn finger protein
MIEIKIPLILELEQLGITDEDSFFRHVDDEIIDGSVHQHFPEAWKDVRSTSSNPDGKTLKYTLQVIVRHVGQNATDGHYITDALFKSQWIRYDDLKVADIAEVFIYLHS